MQGGARLSVITLRLVGTGDALNSHWMTLINKYLIGAQVNRVLE
jgi:hypothetical protein